MKAGKRSWKRHHEEMARQRRVAAETTTLLKMKIRNCGRLHGRGREVVFVCSQDLTGAGGTAQQSRARILFQKTWAQFPALTTVSSLEVQSQRSPHRHQVCTRCTVISAGIALIHINVLKIVSNGFKVLRETAIWSIHN